MSKHTIVLDFSGNEEPEYSANMQLLGGKIVAVAFADGLERVEFLEQQSDDLLEALETCLLIVEHLAKDSAPDTIDAARAAIAKAKGEKA